MATIAPDSRDTPFGDHDNYIDKLPEEILLHIVTHLDSLPPSLQYASRTPLVQDLARKSIPLKRLRQCSKRLCRLVSPILFRHACVTVESCLTSYYNYYCARADLSSGRKKRPGSTYPQWLQYFSEYAPSGGLESLVIYTSRTRDVERANPNKDNIHAMLELLLKAVRIKRLILLCPPPILADLVGSRPFFGDFGSFIIPFQRLELRVKNPDSLLHDMHAITIHPNRVPSNAIFSQLQWDEVEYNAGSSLNAYGTYHYFEKTPPCIFFPQSDRPYQELLKHLTVFSYVCVFPHNHHFNMSILGAVQSMEKLSRLEMRMAPDPSDNLLSDTDSIGRGNLNLRDCWNEVERSYMQIISEILPNHTTLKTFISHDCRIPAFATTLDELWALSSVEGSKQWMKRSIGVYEVNG